MSVIPSKSVAAGPLVTSSSTAVTAAAHTALLSAVGSAADSAFSSASAVAAVCRPVAALAIQSIQPCEPATASPSAVPTDGSAAVASVASPFSVSAVECQPVCLLSLIRQHVLSCMADESELRLRLRVAEQSVTEARMEFEAAVVRAQCSDQLKRVRDEQCVTLQCELSASTERERQCASEAESWRRLLVESRAECSVKLRDAQQRLVKAQRVQQSAAQTGREMKRVSEALQSSEQKRSEMEAELEAERMAHKAAEERAARAEQSLRDMEVESAGRPVTVTGSGREAAEVERLTAQMAAAEERLVQADAAHKQGELDKRELQWKVERMRAFIQQQQRGVGAGAGHSSSGQRAEGKREREEEWEGERKKKQRH